MRVRVRAEAGAGHAGRLRSRLLRCLSALPHARREMSVLLASDGRMRALNRRHRGVDRTTDVLSFGQDGALLGDVAVSVPEARRAARSSGLSVDDELLTVSVHGLLHLAGHDHDAPRRARRMRRAETRLLARYGLRSGLARAGEEAP